MNDNSIPQSRRRFHQLDGMRGICAILVLVYHTFVFAPYNPALYGYLAVDVFFVISGFVIALAFGDRLVNGYGISNFLIARACRLGPVHFFGSMLSVAVLLIIGNSWYEFASLAKAGILNLLLIPLPGSGGQFAFPLNAPTWSLFVEFWVNVGFALIAPRLTVRTLIVIVVAGWSVSAYFALRLGTVGFGPSGIYVYLAILRGGAEFACGVLIFNIWRSGGLNSLPSINPLYVFLASIAVAVLPIPPFHGLHDLVLTALVAPLGIVLLVRSELPVQPFVLWLGRISYPLYATHFAIVYIAPRLLNLHPSIMEEITALTISLAIADGVARWYEPAVKRGLAFVEAASTPRSSGNRSEKWPRSAF